ncbi:MAG: glutathione S-transferase family protein [Actinomycetota bacterium]|nr:glutathione S-transferase family protein [Actinomycetota bacterium]
MIKIWGRKNSVNVQKVLWCCDELGIPYERVDAGGEFGGTHEPEYLAMNPTGLIPTIRDDGFTLWESNTIVRYLAAKYGAGSLWPEDPAARALAEKWMDYQLGTLWVAFRAAFLGLFRTPPEKRDPDQIQASLESTAEALAILDAHLAGEEYVAGADLTVGDVALGSTIYRWLNMEIERPEMPNLEAWHDRLSARPAYQKNVMVPFT